MRISGLASNLDWEQLVEQLMQIERRPLLLLERRKLEIETQRNAWSDVRSRIANLRDRVDGVLAQDLFDRVEVKSSDAARVSAEAGSGAAPGTYRVEVQQLATAHAIATYSEVTTPANSQNLSGTFTISVTVGAATMASFDVTVDPADSLYAIRDKINAAVQAAIKANPNLEPYAVRADVIGGYLVITRTETGAGGIEVSGAVAEDLKLIDNTGAERVVSEGKDAQFKVNDVSFTRSSNTVSGVIQGVTLELHQAAPGQPVDITVAWDDDAVVDAVKKFIEQYNSTLSFMAQQQDYQAAGGGKLGGDVLLITLSNDLRRMVSAPVKALEGSTALDRLAAVGITTQDKSGTLQLDEAKLRQALAADRAGVQRLLAGDPDSASSTDDGVFVRLRKALDGWLQANTGLLDQRIDSLDERARDYADQMDRMQYRLQLREQNLTRQFEALETLLSTLRSQEQWLIQQVNQLASLRPQR
ncbi:flagellar hook-associated 2 domain-containing protein [Thermaerobacter marianensis DSM 12885]|uniref:Flagellar hook-associated protein 2 n=1 Tax=Thermaerobacter marianensis (strain ATCC 700841 / DSM 12885 / JCM 10246 / 7p75a) TaxID=644966 RepID=E6SLP3_THEM7|nr:flagellar filament capping protein FliD [Thermaerobacter marianensis]ADU50310.1 flagellar hook-associated 2 domain-containing protein [Thermaerobacter marianensis DSM 12885]